MSLSDKIVCAIIFGAMVVLFVYGVVLLVGFLLGDVYIGR